MFLFSLQKYFLWKFVGKCSHKISESKIMSSLFTKMVVEPVNRKGLKFIFPFTGKFNFRLIRNVQNRNLKILFVFYSIFLGRATGFLACPYIRRIRVVQDLHFLGDRILGPGPEPRFLGRTGPEDFLQEIRSFFPK